MLAFSVMCEIEILHETDLFSNSNHFRFRTYVFDQTNKIVTMRLLVHVPGHRLLQNVPSTLPNGFIKRQLCSLGMRWNLIWRN